MATIFNTIKKPANGIYSNVEVTVSLTWDTSISSIVSFPDEDSVFYGSYIVSSDDDGYWELDSIIENELLEPAGTLYKIMESTSAGNFTYYVDVPTGATSVFWVGDILASKPSWEA